jgi:DNA-directed RNA polymerase subunit RPC12/RpoP
MCPNCGKLLIKAHTHRQGEKINYVKCRCGYTDLVRRKMNSKQSYNCDLCGTTFESHQSKRPNPLKFCSRQCCWDYQKSIKSDDIADVSLAANERRHTKTPELLKIYLVKNPDGKKELKNGSED